MYDSDFPIKNCSVTRKQDKLYVKECMALTIDLKGMFGLCTFGSSYNLDGREFVCFNVDLVLLEIISPLISWCFVLLY